MQEEDGTKVSTRPDASKSTTKHSMTVLRTFDSQEKYEYSVITIEDDGLRALFLHALSHHPDFSHSGTVTLYSKFEPVIHNWSLLNDFANNTLECVAVSKLQEALKCVDSNNQLAPLKGAGKLEKATSDLKQLLDQVRDTPGLEDYFNSVREMQHTANTITFDYLWTLFPPGELVISKAYEERFQVFIVKECTDYIFKQNRSNDRTWEFECWTYDWDGMEFNRVPIMFTFEDFKGTRSISSLHCYPLKFYREDSDEDNSKGEDRSLVIREALVKRGKRYRELCLKGRGKQIFEYDGFALSRGTGVRKAVKSNQVKIQNRI